ncbi:CsoS2 family carboxysome shell protein [Halothiobacillus sp. DCM-1]|uniref:CsoS2 family carboxysome shell protein n=1 Tax=Halothiobacillus sp. DCM-1 TaxID=3112558 RepID=UPI0032535E6B
MPVQSGNNPADLGGLSGKALARARRAAMATQGKGANPKAPAAQPTPYTQAASSITPPQPVAPQRDAVDALCAIAQDSGTGFGLENNRVRNLCRSRRQALATQGRSALPSKASSAPSGRLRPAQDNRVIDDAGSAQSIITPTDASLDTLCTVAETAPVRLGNQAKSVREICRARRQALSDRGQKAVPPKPTSQGGPGRNGHQLDGYVDTALQGREAAKRHREMLCHYGRGTAPACRPTGRVKQNSEADVPKKVETGHTLTGGAITGTQVERTQRVTGNEPGSCRAVTGTEYVGTEQFQSFCKTKPEANPAKVNLTATARGQKVSGTEVARTQKVTGGEPGTCRAVTGTEYLSNEASLSLCGTPARPMNANKVMIGASARKGLPVSGSDEFRPSVATGNEVGANRSITGTQYADEGAARLTINGKSAAPAKVGLSHTIAGMSISGTEVGRSSKVTGDERGSCRQVSGTEYLSNEQFQSVCGTRPAPSFQKVGVDQSNRGQRITGNLVDRSEKVTGNEPGSCKRVTGSQYSQNRLCGGQFDKVRSMNTLSGNPVTGQSLDHSPKTTGDERGGCMPVTGDEYYGVEHFASSCASTPLPQDQKVAESMTCKGQSVSGTSVDASDLVTGNEYGAYRAVSGTPYLGAQQTGCLPPNHAFSLPMQPAQPVTLSPRFAGYATPVAAPAPVEATAPQEFSIVTPARAAASRITGNAFDQSRRITGPGMLATGLITGTPEFRHGDSAGRPMMRQPMAQAMAAQAQANQVQQAQAAVPVNVLQCAPESGNQERVTGEGENRCRITGDDWSISGRITGTEGSSAQGRNPSMRGQAANLMTARNARSNREVVRPEPPSSRISGSSGNDLSGSLITYSGGARG